MGLNRDGGICFLLKHLCVVILCQNVDVLNTTLVVGRRTNVPVNDTLGVYLPDDVTLLGKMKGRRFMSAAEDYFIMSAEGYPWYCVPRDVVISRVGYDNFLVANALRHRVSVIDATDTILALHQTGKDGNLAGHHGKYHDYNMRLLRRFNLSLHAGRTSDSQYVSKLANDSHNLLTVEILKRPRKNQTRTAVPRTFSRLSVQHDPYIEPAIQTKRTRSRSARKRSS